MGDEHLSTILETESDELIKSNVENLVPIPNPHPFNVEFDLIESLLNRDISTVSYPKIDSFLEEFSGKLAHINLIPPGINKSDFDPEEEIRLIEEFLYDNSSPRPPEESNSEISNATIESSSPSHISVEDSDSLMEEIDLFLVSEDSIPPGGGEIVFSPNVEDDYSFTFVIRTFLPFLTYPKDSSFLLSTGSEDTIFDPDIFT
ncbi:hypothetical protein Tco_0825159 [Tanacetum coccineum]